MAWQEDDYGVVIGINHYAELRPLDGAVNDARRFYEWLTGEDGGGVPPANVRFLTSDETLEHPSVTEYEDFVEDLVAKSFGFTAQIGRRLYLFFAGHGVGPRLDEAAILLPKNRSFRPRYIPGKALADEFVKSALFEEVILFMDCCRDAEWDLLTIDPGFRFQTDAGGAAQVRNLYGYAAGYGQKARERDFDGQIGGVFTYALLEGLQGEAADDSDQITGDGLKRYVERRVDQLRSELSQQDATIYMPRDFVLVQGIANPGGGRIRVTVDRREDEVRLAIKTFDFTPIEAEIEEADDHTWAVELPPGQIYIFIAERDNGELHQLAQEISEEKRHVQR